MIQELSGQIKLIEEEMGKMIEQDSLARERSISKISQGSRVGIGGTMLVYSHNFSRFKNWRQFASYAGIVPFDYESGSSIKRPKKVSCMANKSIKSLLSNAAISSI